MDTITRWCVALTYKYLPIFSPPYKRFVQQLPFKNKRRTKWAKKQVDAKTSFGNPLVLSVAYLMDMPSAVTSTNLFPVCARAWERKRDSDITFCFKANELTWFRFYSKLHLKKNNNNNFCWGEIYERYILFVNKWMWLVMFVSK